MTVGAVAMTAGHLIPAKDPVVGRSANMEVIDRWAVAFNENLAACRYLGSAVFAVGVVFTAVRFWISVISAVDYSGDDYGGGDGEAAKKLGGKRPAQTVRIPITGSVQNVQPDPRAIDLRFGDSS